MIRTITDKAVIKQFILDTLLPYKNNPELCGHDGSHCRYQTDDGKRCAFGKHVKEEYLLELKTREGDSAESVLESLGYDILTDEAKSMDISEKVWNSIQQYHDSIATASATERITMALKGLETKTGILFPELLNN